MNSSQGNNLVVPPSTLKRIYKDLDEINRNPLFGASLCMPNQNDPLTLRANLFILDGPYKDLLIHLIIHLPRDYPITGPAANIAPGLNFGHKYHEHLYDDLENGNQICADLLTNFRGMYDGSKLAKSGWTPAYTLSSVLMQLQVFFADPDYPKHLLPTQEDVEALRKHVREFKSTFQLTDGQEVTHSFDSPYPPISSMTISQKSTEQISKKKDTSDAQEARRNAEEWLYCAISKCNYFDESNPILGYPLDIRQDQFGRYWPTPVVEMISYEAYILKVTSDPYKLENYEGVRFKSSFGELYNFWIPVYITEEHYKRAYRHILNAISVVRKGFRGFEANDFQPQMVLEVIPVILNKMLVQILQGKLHQSMAAINAYCHFYRLLIRLLVEFPELQQKIDDSVDAMLKGEANRHKSVLGDMGEFLIKLALSKYGIQNASINEVLLEECLAREVLWVLKAEPRILSQNLKPQNFCKTFMNHVRVSHQLRVVAVETVKLVINASTLSEADNQFGLLPKKTMDLYQKKLAWIRDTVAVNGNWEVFVSSFKVDRLIRSDEDMAMMLMKAFETSKRQGYTYTSDQSSYNPKTSNDYIPHNSNFDFARATRTDGSDRNVLLEQTPVKKSVVMSTATWGDMKVDLTDFEIESKKTDMSNSTAESSVINDSDDFKKKSTQKVKHWHNQRKGDDSHSEKSRKSERKDEKKQPVKKEPKETKPKISVTKVSGSGVLSSATWSEAGGIKKKVLPKASKELTSLKTK